MQDLYDPVIKRICQVWIEPGAEGNLKDHIIVEGLLKMRAAVEGWSERGFPLQREKSPLKSVDTIHAYISVSSVYVCTYKGLLFLKIINIKREVPYTL